MCTRTGIEHVYWRAQGVAPGKAWPSKVSAMPLGLKCNFDNLNKTLVAEQRLNMCTRALPLARHGRLGLSMCIGTGIKHVYQGVQGACPWQAVTSTRGTAELARSVQ